MTPVPRTVHSVTVFGDAGPVLRSHRVNNLQDRVNLIRKLIWYGEAAFNRSLPPRGGLLDPQMRQLGLMVTAGCRARNDMCELDAIYRFVTMRGPDGHPNVRYTGDITDKDTFQSGLRTLQYRGGDCLPLSTLVLCLNRGRAEGSFVPIREIGEGDHIMGDGDWTRVERSWFTGHKPILVFRLNNDTSLRCSPEHRLLFLGGMECRAAQVRVGEHLLTPRTEISLGGGNVFPVQPEGVRVVAIDRAPPELCMDLTTDTGRFWLPECNALVHNCDDHSALCAVLAMENGFRTRARITSNTGASWDHIYCLAGYPKSDPTRWVALDTTLPGGNKFNIHPPQAKHQDFDLDQLR